MLANIILVASLFMFSSDCATPGSDLRSLPSQGVSLSTGRVIVGLHACSDAVRADCGWYRFVNNPQPDTNHCWRVTNYVFHATGTVENAWSQYTPEPEVKCYSKASIIENLLKLNGDNNHATKWDIVKAALVEADLMDLWNACTYIESTHHAFIAAKPQIAELLGMSEEEVDAFLDTCLY